MQQKYFIFDPNRCLGCRACQTACALNHDLPAGVVLRRIKEVEIRIQGYFFKYYLSTSCNHCLNPECFRLCPNHVYRKLKNGIVVLDESRCDGCGTCTRSCPFNAPVLLPTTGKAIKCDLCYGKLGAKDSHFCIMACPTNALTLASLPKLKKKFLLKTLPGVPRIQVTRPAIRYYPLKAGKQVGGNFRNK